MQVWRERLPPHLCMLSDLVDIVAVDIVAVPVSSFTSVYLARLHTS